MIEGVHKLAVLKFQSNLIRLSIKCKIGKFWVIGTVGIYQGLVRTRTNQKIPENLYIKAHTGRY